MMRAIVQENYGLPKQVLQLREISKPLVGDDEVLVRVHATSVHPDVWHVVTGQPYILRLMGAGLFRPKIRVPGTDAAGTVEAVGNAVTQFHPGDAVFGETHTKLQWRNGGAFAEYVSAPQEALALIPKKITFEQAASVPTSGFIAVHNLQSEGRIRPGQRVLINGAAGGVGTTALQLAKACGAHVTAVDGTDKLEMVRSLGADRVIDYTQKKFTDSGERYDLIFDVASNLTLSECKRALAPAGIYVFIGHDHFGKAAGRIFGSMPRALKLAALAPFIKQLPRPNFSIPGKKAVMDLLAGLLDKGALTPVIDSAYPLEAASEALGRLQSGHAKGKIIITP